MFEKLFENLKMRQFENEAIAAARNRLKIFLTVSHLHNFQIFKLSNYLINSVFNPPHKVVLSGLNGY